MKSTSVTMNECTPYEAKITVKGTGSEWWPEITFSLEQLNPQTATGQSSTWKLEDESTAQEAFVAAVKMLSDLKRAFQYVARYPEQFGE